MKIRNWTFIFFFSVFPLIPLLQAETRDSKNPDSILNQIGISQNLNAQIPFDLEFLDENAQKVTLGKYFTGKPVLLMPVYYKCPMLCGLILKGVLKSLRILKFSAGKEFDIISFTINPKETPDLAKAKKESVLKEYTRETAEAGWHFLTSPGNEEPIKKLTQALGFRYAYDEKADEYAHPAAFMIITPEGKVARYFTGIEYSVNDMRLSLIEASNHKIGSLIDAVILLCYHYDPVTGKYGILIHRVIKLFGILTMILLFGFIGLSLMKEKK